MAEALARRRYPKKLLKEAVLRLCAGHRQSFLPPFGPDSRENYMLVEGGVMFEAIHKDDMQDAVNQLFATFVSAKEVEAHEQASVMLRHGWANVLKVSGLKKRNDLQKPYDVRCSIEGVSRTMKWDNGIGNGVPEALFQRTLLHRDESVNSTFAMLEAVTAKQPILPKERCAAVIHATPEDMDDESVRSAVEYLGLHGSVLNAADLEQSVEMVRQMNLPPSHDAA